MRNHLVAYFAEHHKIVEADALKLLLESPQPLLASRRVLEMLGTETPLVTAEFVERVLGASRALERAASASYPSVSVPETRAPAYSLIREGFSPATGAAPLVAFGQLFQSRFQLLGKLLKGRHDLPNLHPLGELRRSEGTVSAIAMVRDVRQTAGKAPLHRPYRGLERGARGARAEGLRRGPLGLPARTRSSAFGSRSPGNGNVGSPSSRRSSARTSRSSGAIISPTARAA